MTPETKHILGLIDGYGSEPDVDSAIVQFGRIRDAVEDLAQRATAALARVAELEAERAVLVKGVLAADTVCLFRDTGNDWRAFIEAKELAQELRQWPKEGK
jgi:hypothetical protein